MNSMGFPGDFGASRSMIAPSAPMAYPPDFNGLRRP